MRSTLAGLVVALVASACTPAPRQAQPVTLLGRVTLTDTGVSSDASATAAFRALEPGEGVPAHPYPLDECQVSASFGREAWAPRVAAGGSISIVDVNGEAHAMLEEVDATSGPLYGHIGWQAPGSLSSGGLLLHVNGGPVAPLNGSPFPGAPAPLDVQSPVPGVPASTDTTFVWTPAGLDAVLIAGLGDLPGGESLSFTCHATDDGRFQLPPATRAELTARGFTRTRLLRVGAIRMNTVTRSGARLYLLTRSVRAL